MRIQGPYSDPVSLRTSARTDKSEAAGKSEEQSGVHVSDSAQQISAAAQRGQEARAERVAQLKQSIAGGTYKVDKKALADRLADEELARAAQ